MTTFLLGFSIGLATSLTLDWLLRHLEQRRTRQRAAATLDAELEELLSSATDPEE